MTGWTWAEAKPVASNGGGFFVATNIGAGGSKWQLKASSWLYLDPNKPGNTPECFQIQIVPIGRIPEIISHQPDKF